LRNYYRSTKSHNTISIDNLEQNDFIHPYLFTLKNDAEVKVNSIKDSKENSIIDIEHNGYEKKTGIIHNRIFNFDKTNSIIEIKDIIK